MGYLYLGLKFLVGERNWGVYWGRGGSGVLRGSSKHFKTNPPILYEVNYFDRCYKFNL